MKTTTNFKDPMALTYMWHGQRVTDSRRIASIFGKHHSDVTHSIRLRESKLPEGCYHWTTYTSRLGKKTIEHPVAIINRHGFDALLKRRLNDEQKKLRKKMLTELSVGKLKLPEEKVQPEKPAEESSSAKDNFNRLVERAQAEINQYYCIYDPKERKQGFKTALSEALMDLPRPMTSIDTAEMANTCQLIKSAHEHIIAIYRDTYSLSSDEEEVVSQALCNYIDVLTTNIIIRFMRGNINESEWAKI